MSGRWRRAPLVCVTGLSDRRTGGDLLNKKLFLSFVSVRNPIDCWLWVGSCSKTHGNTYGYFTVPTGTRRSRTVSAHRYSYRLFKGAIPKGFVIDHICRNGLCVNPDHLEAVTNKENILRGNGVCANNARKTSCYRGHLLVDENLRIGPKGGRVCRQCEREYNAKRPNRSSHKILSLSPSRCG